MSYIIDTFKLKELVNIIMPVASLYKNANKDWLPHRMRNNYGTETFIILETELIGKIVKDMFYMEGISCRGEGSNIIMHDILIPALEESTGLLIAVCVWEGGDSITRLEVHDGVVKWFSIEL